MMSSAHPAGLYSNDKKSTQQATSLTFYLESTDTSDGESYQRFACQPCQKRSELMRTLNVIETSAEILKNFPGSILKITVEGFWNNTYLRYIYSDVAALKNFINTVVAVDLLRQMRIIDNPEFTTISVAGQEYLKNNLHLFPELCEELSDYSQFINGKDEKIDRTNGTGEFAASYKNELIFEIISPKIPELHKWLNANNQGIVFTPATLKA